MKQYLNIKIKSNMIGKKRVLYILIAASQYQWAVIISALSYTVSLVFIKA